MLRRLIARLPDLRGRQRLLATLDRVLGPAKFTCPAGVNILGYASSTQDRLFLSQQNGTDILSRAIRDLPKDGRFIDCGANCGFYSALAAQHLGADATVFSIEPSMREYTRLAWAIRNNPHSCNWIPLNLALGDADRTVILDLATGHTGLNKVCGGKHAPSLSQKVAQFQLDNLLNPLLPSGAIDLLKIDVEGFEVAVLRGASDLLAQQRIKAMVVEVTDRFLRTYGSSKRELYELLQGYGYSATVRSEDWQYDELFTLAGPCC